MGVSETDRYDYAARQTATSLASLGQVLVNLTDANIRALLSDAADELMLPHRRTEATAVLAQLRKLNPAIASHFRLKEETPATIPLRMVCSPKPNSVPSFIAVSYCWHYPRWPISQHAQPITPGWKISLPMVHAIMGHRQSADEGIWMDQLCINQDDAEDKITHIGAMNIIYRSARRVVILLEDVDLTGDEVSAGLMYAGFYAALTREVKEIDQPAKDEFIEAYFPRQEQVHQLEPDGSRAIRSFALKMLGARWFSRAWCAHESRTAPHPKVNNPLLLCYSDDGTVLSFEFRFVYFLSYYLCKTEPPETSTGAALSTSMKHLDPTNLRHLWYRMIRLLPERTNTKAPMQQLVSILSFGCQEKGDLVSIALNTWELPLNYDGKLDAVEQGTLVFSLLAIASGDLTPLVMRGTKLRIYDENTGKRIVSWLVNPLHDVFDGRMPLTLDGSITAATPEYIGLDLLVFTELPKDATPDSFLKAAAVIEKHNLMELHRDITAAADEAVQQTMRSLTIQMSKMRPDGQGPLQEFHQRFLALALDCGLDWILRFADFMEAESWTDWSYGTMDATTNPQLADAAYSLLALFDVPKDSVSATPDCVDNSIRFLTLLLDPRLPFLTINPRRLAIGPGPADSAIVPAVSNRCWIAVPAAVAHLPAWQERAWVVERLDQNGNAVSLGPLLTSDAGSARVEGGEDTGNWQLRRRERIFGADLRPQGLLTRDDPDDRPGFRHATLLRGQRVYGAEDYDWRAAQETTGIP
jgi:hypothetical protein